MSSETERQRREQANANSNLLKLPAELRVRIYTLVLGIHARSWTSVRPKNLTPAILRTSRQLRSETTPIWYGKQYFVFVEPSSSSTAAWLKSLTPQAVSSLRHISLNVASDKVCKHSATDFHDTCHHYLQLNIDRDSKGFDYRVRCIEDPLFVTSRYIAVNCPIAVKLKVKTMGVFLNCMGKRGTGYTTSLVEVLLAVSAICEDLRKSEDRRESTICTWLSAGECRDGLFCWRR